MPTLATTPAPLDRDIAPPGLSACSPELDHLRHRLNCRLLRQAGWLEQAEELLPSLRRGESPIDWMVRYGLARSPRDAAEALIVAHGLTEHRDSLLLEPALPDALA